MEEYEIWTRVPPGTAWRFYLGRLTRLQAVALCEGLDRDGWQYELISSKHRTLVDTNAGYRPRPS